MAFSMENRRYATNSKKGEPHLPGQPAGSVFPGPVCEADADGNNTWLEYVADKQNAEAELFWFVIYDKDGRPTPMNVSPIFTRTDLGTMLSRFAVLIPR